MRDYLAALRDRVLLFDGAMGTQLMALDLTDEDFGGPQYHGCNEALVLTRPDVIERIHRDYFAAGADVVETDSFTASRLKLDEYGLGAKTREVNLAAAQIARRAADAFESPDRPRFVAGSLGPTGMLISSSDPSLSKITFDELADLYHEQAAALIEGGVDLLLLETSQDLLEMKAAIAGITRAFAGRRAARADPGAGDARRHRPDAAGHRHRRGLRDARRAADRRHRAELLDRPGAHARPDPLPGRELALLRERDPQRRPAADGPARARRSIPRRRPRWRASWARSCATSASTRSAAAAAPRPSTSPPSAAALDALAASGYAPRLPAAQAACSTRPRR